MTENEAKPEMKPWQHGYELDDLKEKASLFKLVVKPLCNGAFGCPKERDVAAALKEGQFVSRVATASPKRERKLVEGEAGEWGRVETEGAALEKEETGKATAIVKKLSVGSTRHDFAGRDFSFRAGDIVIECIAWEPGNRGGIAAAKEIIEENLSHVVKASGTGLVNQGASLWVKTHQDREDLVRMLDAHGFELLAVQVSAGSDVIGYWCQGPGRAAALKRMPAITRAEARTLALLSEEQYLSDEDITEIIGEIKQASDYFAQHYSSYNKRHSWTAMALHGYDPSDPTFIIKPSEMSKKWQAENPERMTAKPGWTALKDMMPKTVEVVSRLPGGVRDRVRIMRLAPGGELTRHADITDRDAGVADGKLARIHIPLRTTKNCRFRAWDLLGHEKRGCMPKGYMCYLDQRKPHACKNDSDYERLHLVVDVESNEDIRNRLSQGWELPA